MTLTGALEMTALRLDVPPWLLGKRALLRFAGICVLAVISLTLSAIVTEHTRQARVWVSDSREVQRAIDKFVWDLLGLQQATQAHRLDRGPDHARRFAEIRNGVRADIDALIRQTLDNPVQQQLLAPLDARSTHYMSNIDRLAASEAAGRAGLDLAPSLMADADEMSRLIGEMRDHEDSLLQSRSELAETSFELLLPTLFVSAGLIALLLAMAAKSINRVVRQRDIWLVEKEGELAAKDMLMREVDHRARNSLDLVYNLMTLQQQRPGNDDYTRNLLAEAANQILVVARVHDRLYRVRVSDHLPVGNFLRELCDDIAAYSLPKEQRSLIRIQAAEAELPAEQAIWFGLIVVELVTNALKYGSPSVDGPILVEVSHLDGQLRVTVSDGGRGLPEDFDPRSPKGLGMQVVGLLVKQLHGTLTIDRAWRGARFIVTMPLQDRRDHDRVASATAASVKTSAAIWPGPSGSCSATAETVTPMIGTAMVPIAATDAGSRARAANQLR
jgi:two-component sensor histidine kinase